MQNMSHHEHVRGACDAAREHAEKSMYLLQYAHGGLDADVTCDEQRCLGQQIRRRTDKAMKALSPNEPLADELADALENLRLDVEEMATWAAAKRDELKRLWETDQVRYGETHSEACLAGERMRQQVFRSGNRAFEVAARIRAGAPLAVQLDGATRPSAASPAASPSEPAARLPRKLAVTGAGREQEPVESKRPTAAGGEEASARAPEPLPAPLCTWREILAAVGMKSNEEDREKVRKLNNKYGGPIKIGTRGKQPTAIKADLLAWWNTLERLVAEKQQQEADEKATVADQYNYARTGRVAPGIGGSVRQRRSPEQEGE
jgi:hypothetical protein